MVLQLHKLDNIAELKISTSLFVIGLLQFREILSNAFSKLAVSTKQMQKFRYFGVAFMSAERQNKEYYVWLGKASVVMRALHQTIVLKHEQSTKAKLSEYK